MAYNVRGLLLRWHSKYLLPERQTSSEPVAEDNNKNRTKDFQPEPPMNREPKADVYSFSQR